MKRGDSRRTWSIVLVGTGAVIVVGAILAMLGAFLQSGQPMDLSSFVPDLLVAAVTGAIIAGTVFWLERRSARQIESRLAEDEWRRAKQRVLNAMRAPRSYQPPMPGERFTSLLEIYEPFVEIVDELPIERWARTPARDDGLAAVAVLATATQDFRAAAEHASARLVSNPGLSHMTEAFATQWIAFPPQDAEAFREECDEAGMPRGILTDEYAGEVVRTWRRFRDAWDSARLYYGIS